MTRVLRALEFLAVAVVLYLGAFVVMSRWNTSKGTLILRTGEHYLEPGRGSWSRYKEFDPAKWHDVIIIGSSHAYRGYDPSVFAEHGASAFNLGSPSQSPLNSYVLLKHFVDSTNTGLVVFDVFEGIFSSTAIESGMDQISNLHNIPAAFEMALRVGGIPAFNMFTLRLTAPTSGAPKLDPDYHGLGFGAKTGIVHVPLKPDTGTRFEPTGKQDRYFRMCVDLCRERGVPMVVVEHYMRVGTNKPKHVAFTNYLDSVLRGRNTPFLDFTFAPTIKDPDYFFDNNHLNLTGARIFTEQLVDTLESLGYLDRSLP